MMQYDIQVFSDCLNAEEWPALFQTMSE